MKALLTGITGQTGSYLAELLLEKGYEVHGLVRRLSIIGTKRIDKIIDRVHLQFGDLTDANSIHKVLLSVKPDEIYNLGAQSHVRVSFDIPIYTADVNALGSLRILEAIKNFLPDAKFYQASSSEMFGKVQEVPQKETTPFYPRSPYGVAKTFAFYITRVYREAYGLRAYNGILFNHESPRRGDTFITKKLVNGFREIKEGKKDFVLVGNLEAKRDWSHAQDYAEAIWQIVQQDKPDDYVIATGETHSVRELVGEIALLNGYKLTWSGLGKDEIGSDERTGRVLVKIDERYFRPAEVDFLQGDATKALNTFGWKPRIKFRELIKNMVEESWKKDGSRM